MPLLTVVVSILIYLVCFVIDAILISPICNFVVRKTFNSYDSFKNYLENRNFKDLVY